MRGDLGTWGLGTQFLPISLLPYLPTSLSPHQPQPSNVKNIHLKGTGDWERTIILINKSLSIFLSHY